MHRRTFLATLAAVVVSAKRSIAMATGVKPGWIQHSRIDESELVDVDLQSTRDVLTRPASASDNHLFPKFSSYFHPSDIVHCPRTGENFRVLAVGVVGDMYVARGVGCVPCAMVKDEPIWILGSASHEGATSERTPIELDEWPQDERKQFFDAVTAPYQRGAQSNYSVGRKAVRNI